VRGTVVKRRSVTGELSTSYGYTLDLQLGVTTYVGKPYAIRSAN